jgi:hypothetical protein
MAIQNVKKFKDIFSTLLHSWGGDAPPEAVWTANELVDLYCEENKIARGTIPELDEDLSNYDAFLKAI